MSGLSERYGLVVLLLALITVFSLTAPETFPTAGNFRVIVTSQSVLALLAVALVFPLVGGRFDISVGANAALSSIVTASAMSRFELPLGVAIVLGVLSGCVVGLISGILVAYLGLNSIIATLGVAIVLGGLIQAYTSGIPVSSNLSPLLTGLSTQNVAGVPVLLPIMLIMSGVAWFVLTQTPFGRYLLAVGSNSSAATLTGLRVRMIIAGSFVLSGLFAGIAGVLQVAVQGNGNPAISGLSFMMPALAAVFLGATTLRPGSYNVPGSILGLLFVAVSVSGLTLLGAQSWVTDVFNGLAVIIAVAISAHFRRRRTGTAEVGE